MPKSKSEISEDKINLAVLAQKVGDIQADVSEIKNKLDNNYATKEWVNSEFGQTRSLVNAIFIAFGLALVGALATFVIRGGLVK